MEFRQAGFEFMIPPYYKNLNPVGRGAFGLVVRADIDPEDQRAFRPDNAYFMQRTSDKVAIKKLSGLTVYKDAYHAKQLYREITLLKQLRHANLIRLVDAFSSPANDLYIVTEAMQTSKQTNKQTSHQCHLLLIFVVQDCDLSAIIQGASIQLEEPHVLFITYQIFRGLNYMHAAGVLHRDLKPQNILVNNALEVRICDLGLARVKTAESDAVTGYVTTRWYRAPEVMLTWQHYTFALDMWSVGCIFGELLNRLHLRATRVDKSGIEKYYAVFPADSHVDHLKAILDMLGVPPQQVIDGITEAPIKQFVLSKARDVAHQISSVEERFSFAGPIAVDLLMSLLNYDPALRLSAEQAMNHPYLATERDLNDEYVRTPIDTAFETFDIALEQWKEMITSEMATMHVVNEGFVSNSFLSQAQQQQQSFLTTAVSVDALTETRFATPAESIGMRSENVDETVEGMISDRDYLSQLATSATIAVSHRDQIINSLDELSARINLYQTQYSSPHF